MCDIVGINSCEYYKEQIDCKRTKATKTLTSLVRVFGDGCVKKTKLKKVLAYYFNR